MCETEEDVLTLRNISVVWSLLLNKTLAHNTDVGLSHCIG